MADSAPPSEIERQKRFGAFESWNFRAYFLGQLLSTVGTWMQTFAQGWLVLELTDQPGQLGITVALQFLPLLLFGASAGVLVDRLDNRRLLMVTSVLGAALSLGIGVLTSSGVVNTWIIYGFALAFGCVSAVERPAMQAILFELVGPHRLGSAISINGIITTAGRLLGAAIAGGVIEVSGIAGCFYINAVSFLVVIATLAVLRRDEMIPRRSTDAGDETGLRAGLRYVRTHPDVLRPLVVMAVMGTLAYNFQITIPTMVKYGYDLGAGPTASVMSLSAVGSIAGGLIIAGIRPHPRRTMAACLGGLTVALALFGAAPSFVWFLIASVPLGLASSMFLTVDATVLQQATEASMQGRVMSLHQIAWFGSTPIGALLMGVLAEATSPRAPFVVGAIAALLCALAIWRPDNMSPTPTGSAA